MRFKPPTMLRKHRVRSLIVAGTVLAAVSGTVLSQSTPALADPQPTLIAVGSDTIQDVWNSFTNGTPAADGQAQVLPALGANLVASYNATNPANGTQHEVITPQDGWSASHNTPVPGPGLLPGDCSFARPNGSGEGVASLRLALNQSSGHASKAFAPKAPLGCVDIARSSSGPDFTDNVPSVDIQFVPFAVDGVTGSTGPSSCTPSTNCPTFTGDFGNGTTASVTTVPTVLGSDIGTATVLQLSSLYQCHRTLIGSTEYFPLGDTTDTKQTGDVVIDLYVPQAGSGTRSFWEGQVGITDTNVDASNGCVTDYITGGPLAFNSVTQPTKFSIEEHDGSAVSSDPNGYGPFSIAQYISQQNPLHNPRFHGAVLQNITDASNVNQSPFNTPGTPTSGMNTAFPILRYVYNVVSLARLTTAGDPIDTLFNGVGSTICKQATMIQAYGFALMGPTVLNGLRCGAISTANPDLEGAP